MSTPIRSWWAVPASERFRARNAARAAFRNSRSAGPRCPRLCSSVPQPRCAIANSSSEPAMRARREARWNHMAARTWAPASLFSLPATYVRSADVQSTRAAASAKWAAVHGQRLTTAHRMTCSEAFATSPATAPSGSSQRLIRGRRRRRSSASARLGESSSVRSRGPEDGWNSPSRSCSDAAAHRSTDSTRSQTIHPRSPPSSSSPSGGSAPRGMGGAGAVRPARGGFASPAGSGSGGGAGAGLLMRGCAAAWERA
jgi:hypothetical protein